MRLEIKPITDLAPQTVAEIKKELEEKAEKENRPNLVESFEQMIAKKGVQVF